jgi:hypothetical protein
MTERQSEGIATSMSEPAASLGLIMFLAGYVTQAPSLGPISTSILSDELSRQGIVRRFFSVMRAMIACLLIKHGVVGTIARKLGDFTQSEFLIKNYRMVFRGLQVGTAFA